MLLYMIFSRDNKIVVAGLEYGPGGVKLSAVFNHTLEANLTHWAIFMTKECVGVLECTPAMHLMGAVDYVSVVSFNLASGRQAIITTDMPGKVNRLARLFKNAALTHVLYNVRALPMHTPVLPPSMTMCLSSSRTKEDRA